MSLIAPKKIPLIRGISKSYVKTINELLPRYCRETEECDQTADNLVGWLRDEVRPTVTTATWNVYKMAMARFLAAEGEDETTSDLLVVDASRCIPRPIKSERRTSGQRVKTVNKVARKQVQAYLRTKNRKWDALLYLWVEVGIQMGLRPHEWRNARMFKLDDEWVLKVKNGKYKKLESHMVASERRAHGEYRHLRLTGLSKEQRDVIQEHLDNLVDYVDNEEKWDTFYQKVRKRLAFVTKTAVRDKNKRFSLYCLRHQFAADAKSSGMGIRELACLMGHAVTETVIEEYGRKSYGNYSPGQEFPIKARADEIAKVIVSPKTERYIQRRTNRLSY